MKHCAQREAEEETGIKVPLSCINSWIQFRTPNCKQIYPTHSWDMQICVSMLFGSKEGVNRKKAEYEQDEDENEHEVAEEEQDKFREPRRSAEAVEAGWFPVDRVLQDERAGKMRLAPPQWFMLHEFITIYGGKDDAFLSAVMHKRTGWPALIQPKLTPFGRSQQWLWSVQSATTGRSVSILMDRHAGGQDGAGYFCNFQIIP